MHSSLRGPSSLAETPRGQFEKAPLRTSQSPASPLLSPHLCSCLSLPRATESLCNPTSLGIDDPYAVPTPSSCSIPINFLTRHIQL